jgi:hypothetical protein
MLSRRSFFILAAAPALKAVENDAWISKLGGQVRRDGAGNLVDVNLRGCWVSTAEILDLLQYKKLARLNLSHTRIADSDLLYLRPAAQIEQLDLAFCEHITDIGLNVIKDWRRLKRLDVSGTQVADATMTILSGLTAMESLDVAGGEVTDDGVQELLPLTNLKHLGLGRSQLAADACAVLSQMDNLQSLDLSGSGNRRGREGGGERMSQPLVEAVAQLNELRTLRVGHSAADLAALKAWAASLKRLERLGLEKCARIDDGALTVIEGWRGLKQVDLQGTPATAARIEQLRKSRPDLKVLASAA